MARRRRNRSIGLVLVVVAVVIAVVAVFLTSGGDETARRRHPVGRETCCRKRRPPRHRPAATPCRRRPTTRTRRATTPTIDHAAHRVVADVATPPAALDVRDDPAGVRTARPVAAPGRDLRLAARRLPDDPLARARRGDHLVRAGHDRQGAGRPASRSTDSRSPTRTSVRRRSSSPRTTTRTRATRGSCPPACRWRSSPGTVSRPAPAVSLPVAFDFSSQFEVPGYGGQTYKGVAREPTHADLAAWRRRTEAAQTAPSDRPAARGAGRHRAAARTPSGGSARSRPGRRGRRPRKRAERSARLRRVAHVRR